MHYYVVGRTSWCGGYVPKQWVPEFYFAQDGLVENNSATKWMRGATPKIIESDVAKYRSIQY